MESKEGDDERTQELLVGHPVSSKYNSTSSSSISSSWSPSSSSSSSSSKNLKIAILASGSRGDIQPYCALACALQNRGHEVVVACEERVRGVVDLFNLKYHKVFGDPTEILHSPEGMKMLENAQFMKLMNIQADHQAKAWVHASHDYEAACDGCDVIVGSALTLTQAWCLAEKNRAKFIPMILGPTLPTSEFPLFVLGVSNLYCLNNFSYELVFGLLWGQEKDKINNFRTKNLNLPPMDPDRGIMGVIDHHRIPILIACSPSFFPNEKIPADYPHHAHVLGFPFVPPCDEKDIPESVVNFLDLARSDNVPVIYLGFGSMPAPDPRKLLEKAQEAVSLAQCRAVLVAGWSALDTNSSFSDPSILIVPSVHHDWLFPRVDVIVHHCGIGTTAAALRSGRPQIPVPLILDQPWNASNIHTLGCSPPPLPFAELTGRTLADRIVTTLRSPVIQGTAERMGKKIALDGNAMEKAAILIENAGVPDFSDEAPQAPCCTGCRIFLMIALIITAALLILKFALNLL